MISPLILDSNNVYRAPLLSSLAWLEHGFGTRLSSDWPGQRQLTTVRQIHSDRVLIAEGMPGEVGVGDALVTSQPGMFVSIRTADCFPILIADPEKRVVAAVHAGWRGAISGICSKTIQAMERSVGSHPNDLLAVIGPGIAECCFEVGPEVAMQFEPFVEERTRIDLEDVIYNQLCRSGLLRERIVKSGICTCCEGEMFHSFRREHEGAGRSISAIGVLF